MLSIVSMTLPPGLLRLGCRPRRQNLPTPKRSRVRGTSPGAAAQRTGRSRVLERQRIDRGNTLRRYTTSTLSRNRSSFPRPALRIPARGARHDRGGRVRGYALAQCGSSSCARAPIVARPGRRRAIPSAARPSTRRPSRRAWSLRTVVKRCTCSTPWATKCHVPFDDHLTSWTSAAAAGDSSMRVVTEQLRQRRSGVLSRARLRFMETATAGSWVYIAKSDSGYGQSGRGTQVGTLGGSWSAQVDHGGSGGLSGGGESTATTFLGRDGSVYYVRAGGYGEYLYFRKSTNGGLSWGPFVSATPPLGLATTSPRRRSPLRPELHDG